MPDRTRRELIPPFAAALAAGVVYYLCSANSVTWAHDSQDSGELIACAFTLGITHPTGYPLYTLVGWVVTHIFYWLDPGRAMVLLSVFSGAIAVGMISRAGAIAIRLIWPEDQKGVMGAEWWGALAGLFALVNPILWSQTVVCEVYSFAILLQAAAWLILVQYIHGCESGDRDLAARRLVAFGFVLGLVLAHHVVGAAILIPGIIIFLHSRPPNPRSTLLKGFLAMLPGLALYLYLPIRSMQNPRFDWGNPETLHWLAAHIAARQYSELVFSVPLNELLRRLDTFGWSDYWGVLGVLLFFVGLVVFLPLRRMSASRGLAIAIPPYVLFTLAFASGYRVSDYDVFYYPLVASFSLAIAPGLMAVARELGRVSRILPMILAVVVVLILASDARNRWIDIDCSTVACNSAMTFAYREASTLPADAIVIAGTDGHLFSLMYALGCGITDPTTGDRLPVRDDVDLIGINWVKHDWFLDSVRDRYSENQRVRFDPPGGDLPAALHAFVEQNLPYRPVYVDLSVLQVLRGGRHSYEVSPTVVFFRILSID